MVVGFYPVKAFQAYKLTRGAVSSPRSAPSCIQVNIGSDYDAPFLLGCGSSGTTYTALSTSDPGLTDGSFFGIAITELGQIQLGNAGRSLITQTSSSSSHISYALLT